ncbi:phage tail protein [Aeromonas sp. BIGb0445]|uniref:phage tail protein n=1 Tax=Aeromonas sp. BIGb0445 TaxID=2940593 RepID=UPI00216A2B20|nr:phage tail protein [Aeromonas sp. BIGb0445]MCS3459239.1 P2-related tail formation protein [Aeromonas sp. BIGb0445]
MTKPTPLSHDLQAPVLADASAPWWEDGITISAAHAEPGFLAKGINAFWQRLKGWLLLPLAQQDPLTCSESLLALLAWERDIGRFDGEPLALFRKRVQFAFVNARDAGEVAGFKRIFERLGIGWCDIHERQTGQPWDVITIEVTDSAMASNQALMSTLIQHYGRTCRRYRFQVVYPVSATIHHGRIAMSQQVFGASLSRNP